MSAMKVFAVVLFLPLFIVNPILYVISFFYPQITRTWFVWIYSNFIAPIGTAEKGLKAAKEKLFRSLHTIVSSDLELRKEGSIRVLEIGPGGGYNFDYLPKNCHYIGIDINADFSKAFKENSGKASNKVKVEKWVVCSAENMQVIPDASIDAIIETYSFCSIQDREAALQEIRRVLVPGGRFFFFEHVRSSNSQWKATGQDLLNPLWGLCYGGCHINRKLGSVLKKAGFSSVSMTSFDIPEFPWVVQPTEMGIAVK